MIFWKHFVGKIRRAGTLTAVTLAIVALPRWSPGQAAPPDQDPSAALPTSENPSAATLEARLRKIEATLELIVSRLNGFAFPADQDPNPSPSVYGPKLSALRPLTSRPAAEFTRNEGTILDTAERRYGIVHENGRSVLQAVALSSGTAIWQCDLGIGLSLGDKALWQLSETEDGKVLRVEATSEDAYLAFTIDAETGRTIKQEISSPSTPRASIAGPRRVPLGYTAGRYRSPPPAPAPVAPQDEMLRLATSYVDAIGNLKLARNKYEQLKTVRGSATLASSELEAAAIHLENAQQKVAVLAAVAEAACETAKAELDFAERMFLTGFTSPNQVVALKAKVKTLEAIVQQRTSASAPTSYGTPSSFAPRK